MSVVYTLSCPQRIFVYTATATENGVTSYSYCVLLSQVHSQLLESSLIDNITRLGRIDLHCFNHVLHTWIIDCMGYGRINTCMYINDWAWKSILGITIALCRKLLLTKCLWLLINLLHLSLDSCGLHSAPWLFLSIQPHSNHACAQAITIVHLTMHLVHPNKCHVTSTMCIICVLLHAYEHNKMCVHVYNMQDPPDCIASKYTCIHCLIHCLAAWLLFSLRERSGDHQCKHFNHQWY